MSHYKSTAVGLIQIQLQLHGFPHQSGLPSLLDGLQSFLGNCLEHKG